MIMTQEEFLKINIATGYIRCPGGDWIISSMATPAQMIYHIEWLKQNNYSL